MKKVLIITYYWPPSGGSGVQRWLKFAKYLPEYGWEPIVLTPENPSFINNDPSLLDEVKNIEVMKLPIWEPYSLFSKLKGGGHQKNVDLSKKQSLKDKIMVWVRGNILLPDPRRFWIRPVSRFLKQYLKEGDIDLIVTTGPPHSMHLIGLKIKGKLGIPWLADFRDPWSEWDILDSFRLNSFARRMHKKWEYRVITRADHVVSVGWEMDKDLRRLGASSSSVITNGFDPADFRNDGRKQTDGNEYVIRHIGSIDELRDPRPFIRVLAEFIKEHESLKIRVEFIGNVTPSVMQDLDKPPYSEFVSFKDYIPHNDVIKLYPQTDLLLLILAHSHSARLNITGKIFEYVASGCPILGVGNPEGDAARVLKESKRGTVIDRENKPEIIEFLKNQVNAELSESYNIESSPYSRKNLTKELTRVMNEIVE